MLSKRIKRTIEVLFFVFTLSFSLIIFNPLSSYIEKIITDKKSELIAVIGEKTGIGFDYVSISPSILKHIVIKNISLYDYATKEAIGTIESIQVEYNILSLIFGNFEDVIKYIKISNANVDLYKGKNTTFIETLNSLVKKDKQEERYEKKESSVNGLKAFFSDLRPLDILITNCSVNLQEKTETGKNRRVHAYVNSAKLQIKEKECYFSLSASSDYREQGNNGEGIKNASLFFEGDGTLKKDLSAGYCDGVFNASHSSFGETKRITLKAVYENDKISIQNSKHDKKNNFDVSWNIKTKELLGNVKCTNFTPASFFLLYDKHSQYSQFISAVISTESTFYFCDKNTWQFNANVDLKLPPLAFKGNRIGKTAIKAVADGKNGQLNVTSFRLSEERVDFNLSGKYDFNTNKTNGIFNINRLLLPTHEIISGNVFFNGSKYLYNLTAPYVNIGSEKIENIKCSVHSQGNKYNFNVALEDEEGKYAFDGSLLLAKNKFLELHVALDSVHSRNILAIAKALSSKAGNIPARIEKIVNDSQITTECYISTDFKNYSYNFVQVIFASISSDSFYTTFQLNGNNSSFSLEKLNVVANKVDLTGRVQGYFEKEGASLDAFFSINSIAYNISAIYVDKNLSVYGDYGITVNMSFESDLLSGAVVVAELPIPIIDSFFSLDANFQITSLQKWNFECNFLKLHRGHENSSTNVSYDIEMKGSGSKDRVLFNEIRLITNDLPLAGSLDIKLDSSQPQTVKTFVEFVLKNETTQEFFNTNAELTLSDKVYVDGKISLKDIALMRFFTNQTIKNTTTAELTFLGSLDDFFITLELTSFNMAVRGNDVVVKGSLFADDKNIKIENCDIVWNKHKINEIEGNLLPFEAQGELTLNYDGVLGADNAKSLLKLSYSGGNKTEYGKESIFVALSRLASNFNVEATFLDLEYGKKVSVEKLSAVLVKEPGVLAVSAGNNDEVYGVYLDDGTVSLHMDEKLPVRCNIDGKISNEAIDLNCTGINIDMPLVWNLTPFIDKATFESGTIVGDMKILGNKKEPEFYSDLKAKGVTATSQYYAPELYGPQDIDIHFSGTTLTVPYTVVKGPTAKLYGSVVSEFSGWIPADTVIKCGTLKNNMGLMKTKNIAYHSDGYVGGDITMTISPGEIYLEGKTTFDNGFFSIPFNDLQKIGKSPTGRPSNWVFRMKLEILMGKKAEYRWPNNEFPILRALIPSEKPAVLTVDSSIGYVDLKGASTIRGGEIFYVKRNFYIREGNIFFAATPEGFEPLVSLRAEIRDKDEGGEPIKIILTAKEQNLENFNPKIETYPPRSEAAVMQMLGQVFIGNVSRENFLQTALTTATDLVAQMGVFKKTESKIRDFLHVDAFSMRTLLIQNAVFGNLFKANSDTPLTIGNYFDNTSVYIGKYFGSQLYADALLHLNYYDPLLAKGGVSRKPVYGNLLFMPELGLEMATPFFLLRSSIAPTRSDTLFVSDTKLTFSWKFSY